MSPQPPAPEETLVFASEDLEVKKSVTETGLRLVLTFDGIEAKGTIVLEQSEFGLYVLCPSVHPDRPVALLDLFYASPEEPTEETGGPPLLIELFAPGQTVDPLGQARFFPDRTRVRFEFAAKELTGNKTMSEKEFGYPPEK